MSWAYTRSQRMRPFTWAQEITTATSPLVISKATPRIMVPPYRLNPYAPLNQGLVAKYISLPGMTGGRLWYDLCGKNNGTLTNMTSGYGWQGPQGRPGGWGAMRFDGSDDYIATPLVVSGSELTVSACVRTSATTGELVAAYSSGSRKFELYMGSGRVSFYIYNGVTGNYRTSSITINDGKWHHVVGVYFGSSIIDVYIDGRKVNGTLTGTVPAAINTNSQVVEIGRYNSGSYWNGHIEDISIYNRALSAAEVAGLYEASKNQYRNEILCAYEV